MFAEFVETYGATIIGTIITAVLGFIGIAAKRMAQKWLDTAEKRRVAREVVTFVEQVYKSCHGEEKLNYALEAAREMLLDQGITFNELEMRVLIESFLGEMNKVFDEDDEKDWQHLQGEEVPSSVETTANITYTNGREEPDEDENSFGMTEEK